MLEIKEVKTKKEQREFLNFPLKLYKNNPYFVPPLYVDEKKIFKKNYVYYDQAEAIYYNAYLDGKIVGRISGIIQHACNNKNNEKRVRFTRFDTIDNQEVASALFQKVETWAKEKGMDTIVGPLGFSDLEREGLLIEGFDQLSTFEEQYNYEYYPQLIENYGFVKEVDWTERKIFVPKQQDERLERISSKMLNRYNLKFGETKNINDFINKYADKLFDIIDETYADIYGTVPLTEGIRQMMIDNFKLIVDLRYVAVIVDENDRVVCFGLCFPSLSKAVQKSKGHLTPLTLMKILKSKRNPRIIDLGLIGVLPEYRGKGVASAMISGLSKKLLNGKIEYAETNLNLETNHSIQNQWKVFESVIHKRRRAYIKEIK